MTDGGKGDLFVTMTSVSQSPCVALLALADVSRKKHEEQADSSGPERSHQHKQPVFCYFKEWDKNTHS